ncbi:hypothetical protein STENM223S_08443 [Streptomyces tendae]
MRSAPTTSPDGPTAARNGGRARPVPHLRIVAIVLTEPQTGDRGRVGRTVVGEPRPQSAAREPKNS